MCGHFCGLSYQEANPRAGTLWIHLYLLNSIQIALDVLGILSHI